MLTYQLQSVTQRYERRGQSVTALNNSNLEIKDNDFIAIVGPSGSGKTTLLSVLGGMLAPSTGQVLLDGQSLYDLSIEQRAELRRTFSLTSRPGTSMRRRDCTS